MRRDRHKCVKRRVAGRAIVATTLVGPSFLIGGCRRSTVCQVGSCKDNDRRYWRATLLACRLTNGSIPARRRGTRWPEGGKGRMSLLLKCPTSFIAFLGIGQHGLRVASEQHACDAPCLHGAGLPE
jgi:hypothetical protein